MTYATTADLRSALTANDPDARSAAYTELAEAGIDPRDVLSDEPPEGLLFEKGVIEETSGSDAMTTQEYRERVIGLLEAIANGGGE